MKVFIVTEGEYSDYQIKAVFSTKEKAEKYIDTHGNDTVNIEEYELDSYDEEDADLFMVSIREDKGEIQDADFMKANKKYYRDGLFITSSPISSFWGFDRVWYFYIACDSGNKAVKIASKRLMQIKVQPYLYKGIFDKKMTPLGLNDYHKFDYFTHEEIKN